jgi:hypothetical protein
MVFLAGVILCDCRRAVDGHRLQGPDASLADGNAIRESIREAERIFVGRLQGADYGWHPHTGAISISRAKMSFTVLATLKGTLPPKTIEVICVLMGNEPYVEQRSDDGKLRLSRPFLREGEDYVVLVSGMHLDPEESIKPYLTGVFGYGLWPATEANVAYFRRAIGAGPSAVLDPPHPRRVR